MENTPLTIFAQEIAVAVTEETAGTGAQFHETRGRAVLARPLLLADLGLVVGQAEVLGPELRRDFHRLLRAERGVDHPLVHALGVHIDLDGASARGDAVEHRLPELVAAFFDAA